jgi:signal transduction histidine kinase
MLARVGESSRIAITADIQDIGDGLAPEAGINLYRIVQETVSNIVKHAQATEARVTLHRGPHGIELSVSDNGRGLSQPPDGRPGADGFGLRSLAARAKLLGGTSRIHSTPGQGTMVVVEVPVAAVGPE